MHAALRQQNRRSVFIPHRRPVRAPLARQPHPPRRSFRDFPFLFALGTLKEIRKRGLITSWLNVSRRKVFVANGIHLILINGSKTFSIGVWGIDDDPELRRGARAQQVLIDPRPSREKKNRVIKVLADICTGPCDEDILLGDANADLLHKIIMASKLRYV